MPVYVLFAFDKFYPLGGMKDCQLITTSPTAIIDWIQADKRGADDGGWGYEYYQVVDTNNPQVLIGKKKLKRLSKQEKGEF